MRKTTHASRLFRRWSTRDASALADYPDVDARTVTFLGNVTEISYLSDKWRTPGDYREYVHKFKRPTALVSTANGKALLFLPLPGPRVIVTRAGIVG